MSSAVSYPRQATSRPLGTTARLLLGLVGAYLAGVGMGWAAPIDHVDPTLPSYQARAITLDRSKGYVQPDGSIQIVGFDDMDGILSRLNEMFIRAHPGFKFAMVLKGNGPAIPALTYDASAFAPMGGGATVLQLLPYEKILGSKAEPVAALAIRVAHASLNPQAKLAPLGIIVNKNNPLASLTQAQVTRILASGSDSSDIDGWSQLGVTGPLAGSSIHPVGLWEDAYHRPEDLGMGEYMMYTKMGAFPGFPFSPRYERLTRYADVVKRVSADPQSLGLVALNKVTPDVKLVALVGNDGHTLTTGSETDIVAGKYPYDRYLYIYVKRVPGEPFDPFVKEYLRMVLSKQGQEAIARDATGYLPLNAKEVSAELAKLERAETWDDRKKQGPMLNYPFPSPEP